MLVFEERRKPEYPEKNLPEQGRETTTNSTHIWRRVRESNPRATLVGGLRGRWMLNHCAIPTPLSDSKTRLIDPTFHALTSGRALRKLSNTFFPLTFSKSVVNLVPKLQCRTFSCRRAFATQFTQCDLYKPYSHPNRRDRCLHSFSNDCSLLSDGKTMWIVVVKWRQRKNGLLSGNQP